MTDIKDIITGMTDDELIDRLVPLLARGDAIAELIRRYRLAWQSGYNVGLDVGYRRGASRFAAGCSDEEAKP